MANPQVEDGFVRISNEVFAALCRTRIPGEARMVLDFIIRKTWGFGKREDKISLSQLALGTGLKKTKVIRARQKLVEMNLIRIPQKGNDDMQTYLFNKDFESWTPFPKRGPGVPKRGMTVPQKGNEGVPKRGPTIDTLTKDNVTKDRGVSVPKKRETDPRIRQVLDHFHEAHLRTKDFKPLLDAKAAALAKRLIGTYDLDFTIELIEEFFESEDDFIANAGYSFGVFYSQAQKLANRMRGEGGRGAEAWYRKQIREGKAT